MRKSAICCPCVDCENVLQFPSAMDVHAHLIVWGFMGNYKYWNKHEEGGVNDRDLQASRMGHQCCSEEDGCHSPVLQLHSEHTEEHSVPMGP